MARFTAVWAALLGGGLKRAPREREALGLPTDRPLWERVSLGWASL
jgi:hypothetical protein